MLFDLRSRGRRRTVQVIYLGLAVLMMGGLVLFGVGAGNGVGGLLNAFTNNGSGNNGQSNVDQATKAALKTTRLHPTEPSAWSSLLQAQYGAAHLGTNYNSTTGAYSTLGKKELSDAVQSWQRYLKLVKSPDLVTATLAARSYEGLASYAGEATAWEYVSLAAPTQVKGFECLAAAAYAAKQTRKGNLAAAKALTLVPKLQRLTLKQALNTAKTQPAVAQSC